MAQTTGSSNVRKDSFFIATRLYGEIAAEKRYGYIDGDLGAYQQCGGWVITYIPTGQKILAVPVNSVKIAFRKAREKIKREPNFDKLVEQAMKSDFYKAFLKSRHDKTITQVF